jgi:polyisoprenyl-phosphate glycosyltransferase
MVVDVGEAPVTARSRLVSVVVPVYGNQETVAETLTQIMAVHDSALPHVDLEVVFVDDGSPDGSWDELERLMAANEGTVVLVRLSRNFGQLSAILAGYGVARGDAVITISADLQDPVDIIPEMVRQWEAGQDVVVAHRSGRDDDALSVWFSSIAYGFARWANPRMPRGGFDYVLLSRRATELINTFRGRHRFFQGDILFLGFPTTFIPYTRRRRTHGRSGWTIRKKFTFFVDLVLDSSYFPIRVMTALGFVTASVGLLYACLITIGWLLDSTPFSGFAAIMVALLLIGGLIMVMLGIIGEYLWRIYDDVKARPLYVIDEVRIARAATPAAPDEDR